MLTGILLLECTTPHKGNKQLRIAIPHDKHNEIEKFNEIEALQVSPTSRNAKNQDYFGVAIRMNGKNQIMKVNNKDNKPFNYDSALFTSWEKEGGYTNTPEAMQQIDKGVSNCMEFLTMIYSALTKQETIIRAFERNAETPDKSAIKEFSKAIGNNVAVMVEVFKREQGFFATQMAVSLANPHISPNLEEKILGAVKLLSDTNNIMKSCDEALLYMQKGISMKSGFFGNKTQQFLHIQEYLKDAMLAQKEIVTKIDQPIVSSSNQEHQIKFKQIDSEKYTKYTYEMETVSVERQAIQKDHLTKMLNDSKNEKAGILRKLDETFKDVITQFDFKIKNNSNTFEKSFKQLVNTSENAFYFSQQRENIKLKKKFVNNIDSAIDKHNKNPTKSSDFYTNVAKFFSDASKKFIERKKSQTEKKICEMIEEFSKTIKKDNVTKGVEILSQWKTLQAEWLNKAKDAPIRYNVAKADFDFATGDTTAYDCSADYLKEIDNELNSPSVRYDNTKKEIIDNFSSSSSSSASKPGNENTTKIELPTNESNNIKITSNSGKEIIITLIGVGAALPVAAWKISDEIHKNEIVHQNTSREGSQPKNVSEAADQIDENLHDSSTIHSDSN